MGDIIRRVVWFAIVATAVAYTFYLIVGSIVNAQAAGYDAPVVIRDRLSANSHNLTGMLMVPASCDQLSVRTQPSSGRTYVLIFETWRDPAVECSSEQVPRAFHSVVFAPAAGVDFIATLDGKSLPISIIPVLPER